MRMRACARKAYGALPGYHSLRAGIVWGRSSGRLMAEDKTVSGARCVGFSILCSRRANACRILLARCVSAFLFAL